MFFKTISPVRCVAVRFSETDTVIPVSVLITSHHSGFSSIVAVVGLSNCSVCEPASLVKVRAVLAIFMGSWNGA